MKNDKDYVISRKEDRTIITIFPMFKKVEKKLSMLFEDIGVTKRYPSNLSKGKSRTRMVNMWVNIKYLLFSFEIFYKKIDHFKPTIITMKVEIFDILRSNMYDNNNTKAKKGVVEHYSQKTVI